MDRRLARYREMRDFGRTPEPSDAGVPSAGGLQFSVQKHAARRLHFDLRLEWDGVLLSWAVTRGPSADPGQKRLAVRTEDHPLAYLTFEGTIPAGGYGAGTVMLWDLGWWAPLVDLADGLADGMVKFAVLGRRMSGRWMLVRMKGGRQGDRGRENWLLVKETDAAATRAPDGLTEDHVVSVATGRDMDGIAADGPAVPPARGMARPKPRAPQLATLRDAPPDGDGWQVEPKHDGYRAMIALGRGGARIWTRNGHDWTDRFGPLLPWLDDVVCDAALIDGEVVAGLGAGSFDGLKAMLSSGGPLAFYAFDLLALDGRDLTGAPLRERRAALAQLLADAAPLGALRLSPAVEGGAADALARICAAGGEGILCKRPDAPYRGRRTAGWVKVKCAVQADFVIVGKAVSDRPGRPFASLLMARRAGDDLVYSGRVGTGFDAAAFAELTAAMAPLGQGGCPLSSVPADARRGVDWLAPRLVAAVRHAELTRAGHIRHGVYVGLREDEPAAQVRAGHAAPPSRAAAAEAAEASKAASTGRAAEAGRAEATKAGRTGPVVAGVTISSPRRVVFPEAAVTKRQLALYYEAVAPALLAIASGRPLSLVRHPSGLAGPGFFQRHAGDGFPAAIRRLPITSTDGDTADYMYVADPEGIVAAVQMGTIEFHLWAARRDRLDRPDRLVFDLDPDPAVGFAEVRAAAADIRDLLAAMGLAAGALVTGGKGVHVVVPLRRTVGWDTLKGFAQTFATVLAQAEPDRFVATMAKSRRVGRIFIDWLRNERGATAIAPFSVRARRMAPVAVPVGWDELAALREADAFGLDAARERAASPSPQPVSSTLGKAAVVGLERLAAGR